MVKIYSSLAALFVVSTFSQTAFSADSDKTGVSGQVRFGYTQAEDSAGAKVDAAAIGGNIGYISPVWQGFNVGANIYSTNVLGKYDDDDRFLDREGGPNGSGYTVLGEAWLQAAFNKTAIKIGRQLINTPFADTDHIGMIPNTFEAAVVTNNSLANTTFIGMHLHKAAGIDTTKEDFTRINGTKGVNAIAAVYEVDQWNGQFWYYDQQDSVDISYIELGFNAAENLELGLQYTTQKDQTNGGRGKAWGASVAYAIADFSLSTAYNKVSGRNSVINAVGGVGGGPFFTSAEENTIDGVANIRAHAVGIEYTGIPKLTLGLNHVDFDQGVGDEIDVTASYAVNDNLTVDLIHSDMDIDGKNDRVFINNNFAL